MALSRRRIDGVEGAIGRLDTVAATCGVGKAPTRRRDPPRRRRMTKRTPRTNTPMIVPTAQLLSTIDDPSRGSQQIVYSPLGLHLTISGSSSLAP